MELHWTLESMVGWVKYVVDTEDYGLKIKPNRRGEMFVLGRNFLMSDMQETDTRVSVYGYIIYFVELPLRVKSSQKSVTLSSTEAVLRAFRKWQKKSFSWNGWWIYGLQTKLPYCD
jgi:hypothetical protein